MNWYMRDGIVARDQDSAKGIASAVVSGTWKYMVFNSYLSINMLMHTTLASSGIPFAIGKQNSVHMLTLLCL